MPKPTVIVVDDDRLICEEIARMLSPLFDVLATCPNGKAALTQMSQKPAQLIVTDISMPVMDGVSLIRTVRKLWRDTVLVVLSNYDDFTYVKEAMREGACEYLLKEDIDDEAFAATVWKLFCAATGEAESGLESGLESAKTVRVEILRVMEYLQTHYAEPVSLEQLAGLAGFSCNYFCTLFKEETGYSCMEYLHRVRVDRAVALLEQGGVRTCEVADQTGFRDYRYFCRIFKELTGRTPGSYRRRSAEGKP